MPGITLITSVCGSLVSTPPFAVPPLSRSRTETRATWLMPFRFAASAYVSVPVDEIDGWTENTALLSFVTTKDRAWPASFTGPALIFVAQFSTVWGPALSASRWSAPFAKLGASLTGATVIETVPIAVPP